MKKISVVLILLVFNNLNAQKSLMEAYFHSGYFSFYYPVDSTSKENEREMYEAAKDVIYRNMDYKIDLGPNKSKAYRARKTDTLFNMMDYRGVIFDSVKRYSSNRKYPLRDIYEVYKKPGLKFWKTLRTEILETPNGRKAKFTRDTLGFFKDIDHLFPNDTRFLICYNDSTKRWIGLSGNIEWRGQEEFWTQNRYVQKTEANPYGEIKYEFKMNELEEIVKIRMFMFPPEKTKIEDRRFKFLYRIDKENFVYEMVLFDTINKDYIVDRSFRVKTNIYRPLDTMVAYHYSYEPDKLTAKEKEQLTIFKTTYNLNSHIDSAKDRYPKIEKIPYSNLLKELQLEKIYSIDSIIRDVKAMDYVLYRSYYYLDSDNWDLFFGLKYRQPTYFKDNYMGNFVSNYPQFLKDEEAMLKKNLNIKAYENIKKYRQFSYWFNKKRAIEIEEIKKERSKYILEYTEKFKNNIEFNHRF